MTIKNNNTDEFFLMFMEHKIDCIVEAVPFAKTIDWFWQTCNSPNDCSRHEDKWESVVQTDTAAVVFPKIENFMSADGKKNISRLIVKEKRVGWYKCRGMNKLGSDSKSLQYVATGQICIDTELWV